MSPQLFPIDVGTEGGQHVIRLLSAKYGAALATTVSLPTRLFGLVSPLAPGLRFAGAEAALITVGSSVRTVIGSSGSGVTLDDAVAKCLGETVERLSQGERDGDVTRRAPLSVVCTGNGDAFAELIREIASANQLAHDDCVDWISARDLCGTKELWVPADWCLRRAAEGPLRMSATPLSIGVAAGATAESATVCALLELVERDAVAQWWIGGRRGRNIGLEDIIASGAAELIAHVRQGQRGRTSWLLDVSSDLPIPTIVAISVDADGKGFAAGMAARLTIQDAIRAAVFEMCQMELGLLVVHLKRQQRGPAALNAIDHQHLARASAIDAARCELIHPFGAAQAIPDHGDRDRLATLQQIMSDACIDVAVVDLTRPDYAVPVCVAVAPALQRFPSPIHTSRLRQAVADTGGGGRWTGGITLS